VADLAQLRSKFPALERTHNGFPVAYFDGPGGTQVPVDVASAMTDYLFHHNANTYWEYPTSAETDAIILGARAALADLVAGDATEIAFGANMTSLTFHVSRALGRRWGPDDTVVVTELDHHANIDPWRALAVERGVKIVSVPLVRETGELDLPALERALDAKPQLLAITAASNALGTMPDVAAAAARAHAAGALVFVDAVHYAPHALVDVHAMGADLLGCSAYKFYGPHIGVLWGRADLIESMSVPKVQPAHENSPERLELGTLNHEGIAGATATVDFLASFGDGATRRERLRDAYAAMHHRSMELFARLWDGLGSIHGVTRYGPPPGRPRSPTVSVSIEGRDPADVARALASRGLFVSHGDFYAATVASRLGHATDGFVRIGISAYTTREEVERVLEAIDD
jgi:cysteine desulfurase family protein (TIGR01976 family)